MSIPTSPPPHRAETAVPAAVGVRVGSSGKAPGPAATGPPVGERSVGILRAMVQFGVPGLAALVLVGLGATVVLRERGEAAIDSVVTTAGVARDGALAAFDDDDDEDAPKKS